MGGLRRQRQWRARLRRTLDAVYALAQSIARVKLAGQPVNQGNVLSALRTALDARGTQV